MHRKEWNVLDLQAVGGSPDQLGAITDGGVPRGCRISDVLRVEFSNQIKDRSIFYLGFRQRSGSPAPDPEILTIRRPIGFDQFFYYLYFQYLTKFQGWPPKPGSHFYS